MPYLRNPVFLGVGAIDQEDRDAALVRNARTDVAYRNAFVATAKLPINQIKDLNAQIMAAVNMLPPAQRQQVLKLSQTVQAQVDPRATPGLGQGPAVAAAAAQTSSISATVANIAGVVASLATVGISIAQFVQNKKMQKEDAERQDAAAAREQAAANAAIKERQQALAQSKASFDAEQKRKELDAAGYTVDASGNVVPKPKNTALTAGAIAAAAAGALFLTK